MDKLEDFLPSYILISLYFSKRILRVFIPAPSVEGLTNMGASAELLANIWGTLRTLPS